MERSQVTYQRPTQKLEDFWTLPLLLRTQDVEDFHLQMHLSESHQNTISQSCSSTKSFLHNYARTPPQSIGVKPCV